MEQEFSITPAAAADSQPGNSIKAILQLQRSRLAGERNLRWLILSFHDANAPAEEGPAF